ncbi:MAG: hypothetical protein AMS19_10010 [Gemmatimonas sp. SG8_23]|jgi:hypothetical protein|nr:MAG: hypothetical protein AMS19_10010 [Gemmatimonas sp. SG8_23]
MSEEVLEVASAQTPTTAQRLFLRYFTAVLVDLVVLGLFAQYWDRVHVDAFSTALLAAVVLQVLLKITMAVEHKVAAFWKNKEGSGAKFGRIFSAWAVLFGSKFVILYALDLAFSEAVHFDGALHGVVPLILVLVVMLVAEEAIVRFYRMLG